jgi:tRNA A37 threonylcarbamoyladenosine synthetase subunit TsaC/SUA5/YrdC
MSNRAPPRFVPTLTEVVANPAASAPAPLQPAAPSHEQIAQRVLQRVDLVLDRRVREAIASVVLEQTSALAPVLRERLDAVVRDVVAQALAEELKSRQRG